MKTNLHTTPAPGRPWAPSPARAAILLSAMLAFVPAAQAAPITWGAVTSVDTTDPAGTILNSSSGQYSEYIDAVTTCDTDKTLNSVVFHAFASTDATDGGYHDDIGKVALSNGGNSGPITGHWGTTELIHSPPNDYDLVLWYTSFSGSQIILSGLEIDRKYQIQVWAPLWNNNFGTLVGGVNLNTGSVPYLGAGGASQTMAGTFTADATSMTIALSANNGYNIPFFPAAVTLFAKPVNLMDVVTLAATDMSSVGFGPFSATLNGTIDDGGGADAAASFKWGLTASYGNTVAATPATVTTGSGLTPVSAVISGLAANTTYHFQAVGNNGSEILGSDMTFTTPAHITTGAASAITYNGATLNGTVDPSGVATTAWFEWGLTDTYGNTTSPVSNVGSGSGYASFDAPLTSLTPTTTYHFRAVANNGTDTVQGPDMVFTTPEHAATITWTGLPGADVNDPTQILKGGTYSEYIDAVTPGPNDLTVNEVLFHAFTSKTANDPGGWNHAGGKIAYTTPSGSAMNDWSQIPTPTTDYGILISYIGLAGGPPAASVNLSGLTVGREYQIQAWAPLWNLPWTFGLGGYTMVCGDTPTVVVGTFTAVETTQNIHLTYGNLGAAYWTPAAVSLFAKPVSATTPFELWAVSKGLDGTAGKENGQLDDPDKDGVNNVAEFAFNGDPLSGADNGRIYSVIAVASDYDPVNPAMILTIAVREGTTFTGTAAHLSSAVPVDGLTYTIDGGTDLNTFNTLVYANSGIHLPVGVSTDPGAGYVFKSFTLVGSETRSTMPKGFLRAKVESNP